jgi:hypothetical protein
MVSCFVVVRFSFDMNFIWTWTDHYHSTPQQAMTAECSLACSVISSPTTAHYCLIKDMSISAENGLH